MGEETELEESFTEERGEDAEEHGVSVLRNIGMRRRDRRWRALGV